jgi:PKD repeat protein
MAIERMGGSMTRHLPTLLITTALAASIGTALAQPGNGNGAAGQKMFGKGHPFTVEDLPPGRTREKLQSLSGPAQARALEWLHRFEFPAQDVDALIISDEGDVLYADPVPPELPAETGPEAEGAAPEPNASASDDAFWLHSRPGAPNVVYLDFDGHSFSNTAWSSGTIDARPFDLDGSPSTFSAGERAAIAEIWHRMAEDLAPFDIDVTTEEPASFGPDTGRVLITSKTDAHGATMPYGTAGGVAYVGVWGYSNYASYYSPALVYYDNLAKATTYIAEACSHEFGHNLGLSHDGTSSVTYYAGHGSGYTSWAPIMGNSYYNNVTQWSNGEYADANNAQDDLAIISGKLDLVTDDHGDTRSAATPLVKDSSGAVVVTNPELDPHNSYPHNKGAIETVGDQDVFSFNVAAGLVDLTIDPAWDAFYRTSKRGANLDIQASLLDANGAILASSDPTSDTSASVSASVAAGTYYLEVKGVGNGNYSDYASAGQYFISGTLPAGTTPNAPPSANFSSACDNLSCDFFDSSSDSDGTIEGWAWGFGDSASSSVQSPSHTYAAAGTYSVSLTVTDDDGANATSTQSVTVIDAPPPDIEKPQVWFTTPSDGAEVSRSVTLTAQAIDNVGVVQVAIYTDGELRCSGTTGASCSWNLRKETAGPHPVTAEATDAAGNRETTSITLNVTSGGGKGGGGGNGGGGNGGGKGGKK